MYYIKRNGEQIILGEDPVYTRCPECGQEHEVSLWGMYEDIPDFDLWHTSCFCEACTRRRGIHIIDNERSH